MRFEKKDEKIYGAIAALTTLTVAGDKRATEVAFRIDGREGSYRVDAIKGIAALPWEAIDGGEGFRTLAEAKRYVRRWFAAARSERTLSPRKVA